MINEASLSSFTVFAGLLSNNQLNNKESYSSDQHT